MDILVLDKNFDTLAVLDVYDSFIWTVRYNEYGDFEIYMPAAACPFVLEFLVRGNYLMNRESDRYMIIEDISIDTDAEIGTFLTVTGRSLESILMRRIVWAETNLKGNLQTELKRLITENIISPSDSKRTIPNFTFRMSTDEEIVKMTTDSHFMGDTVYDAVSLLCKLHHIGFRVLPGDGDNPGFIFELYRGVDRSYDQERVPWVIFSPDFDNLLNSNYVEADTEYKTDILVSYDNDDEYLQVEVGEEKTGLERRETFLDVVDDSPEQIGEDEDGNPVYDYETFYKQLATKGQSELNAHRVTTAFDGEVEASRQFIYGRDFNIGDIVQVRNEYGLKGTCRITEVVQSIDSTGQTISPTFEMID